MLLFAGNGVSDTYYISPQGRDSNPGTLNAPWASLQHAIEVAGAADTVLMREGVYQTDEVWIRGDRGMGGANGQYLTIKNFPGETPSVGGDRRIIVDGPPFLRVEGLHFRLPYRISGGGDGFQVVNNTFEGPQPDYGAIEFFADDGLIEGNVIEITGGGDTQDHGIYLHAGHNIIVRDNIISGSSGYGIHVYDAVASGGQRAADGFNNILMEGNIILGSQLRAGLIIAPDDGEARNIIIRRNVFAHNSINGIRILGATHDVEAYHNTIYGNGFGATHPDDLSAISIRENEAHDIDFRNNIIVIGYIDAYHIQNREGSPGITAERNFYWGPDSLQLFDVIDPSPLFGDPLFVDAENSNFNLQLLSPAIDMGLDAGLPYIGDAPDPGAYEFGVPEISVIPSVLDFGKVEVGLSAADTVKFKGLSAMAIEVLSMTLTGSMGDRFSVKSGGAPFTLEPGIEYQTIIEFLPIEEGINSAMLRIEIDNTELGVINLPLRGAGVVRRPQVQVDSLSHDFGTVEIDSISTKIFTISNVGDADLDIQSVSLTGPDSSQFLVTDTSPLIIGPGSSDSLTVTFAPLEEGLKSAQLRIESNDMDDGPLQIALSGFGGPERSPNISINETTYDFGDIKVDSSVSQTFTIENLGNADLQIVAASFSGLNPEDFSVITRPLPITLSPSALEELVVVFNPATIGAKSATLVIESNDQARNPINVSLIGNAKDVVDAVHDDDGVPVRFALHQNYPNPFNPETEIIYEIAMAARVTINIYDILGHEIVRLIDEQKHPGVHSITWNGKDNRHMSMPSGILICKMVAVSANTDGSFVKTIKMALLR
jgi:parallel beta-helix repeat protein